MSECEMIPTVEKSLSNKYATISGKVVGGSTGRG